MFTCKVLKISQAYKGKAYFLRNKCERWHKIRNGIDLSGSLFCEEEFQFKNQSGKKNNPENIH